jgi:hypothetical protein
MRGELILSTILSPLVKEDYLYAWPPISKATLLMIVWFYNSIRVRKKFGNFSNNA